jgi:hypothetical protein
VQLHGVVAPAADQAFAVGEDDGRALRAEAWDGTRWGLEGVPPVFRAFVLDAAADSGSDVWAVGYAYADKNSVEQTFVEQRDPGGWHQVLSADLLGRRDRLRAVAAFAPDDVWAAGFSIGQGPTTDEVPLIEHWDGASWSIVPIPNSTTNGALMGIGGVSSTDLWAVGGADDQGLAEHWDGSAWTVVPTASPGEGKSYAPTRVAAVASNDVWAVGGTHDIATNTEATLVEHWNGANWSVVPSPSFGQESQLDGIVVLGPADIWATGTADLSPTDARTSFLYEHWDGTSWTRAAAPPAGVNVGFLYGIAKDPDGNLWSVGSFSKIGSGLKPLIERLCPVKVTDSGFSAASSTVPQGSTVAWSFPTTNSSPNTLNDASGLGLFDAGSRAPGSSFTFDYPSAGSYPVGDIHASKSTIKVPISVLPATGSTSMNYTITWASEALPAADVADVQIKRPGGTAFSDWLTNQASSSASFTPDAGPGTYTFRARLRVAGGAAHSGWSPAHKLTAS